MRVDLVKHDLHSSFLSCEKDTETILRKLFVESRPYSQDLKKLLVINTKDCIDNVQSAIYDKKIKEIDLPMLREQGYIKLEPVFQFDEHADVKSYIHLTFDDFIPNDTNPQFRDYSIIIDVLCHTKYWDIGNYRSRPLKICGIIDGILNQSRLSGIGKVEFLGCSELVLDEYLAGYTLVYRTVHGTDDILEDGETL